MSLNPRLGMINPGSRSIETILFTERKRRLKFLDLASDLRDVGEQR